MKSDITPSTQWKEDIAPDEAQRFEAYAKRFTELQAAKSAKYGAGRTLHRKQISAARGQLEVLPDLPAFARAGLFAAPGSHETWLRLSNGGMNIQSDKTPDIRGFALRVFGVAGPSALGEGAAKSQDFTLINQEKFSFPKSAEFMDFVFAAAGGNKALVKYLVKRYGVFSGVARLLRLLKAVGRPFEGFASNPFFSAVPVACGPYAVRVRLVPHPGNGMGRPDAKEDWNRDFSTRLAQQSLRWDLQLQPFVNELVTPIEDASVNWPTPYTTVARLTLPQQNTADASAQAFAKQVESSVFDPWAALAEHRPLGDVQRARKVVYFASQQGRGAA